MNENLFGTDGIRGKVNLAISDDKSAIDKLKLERQVSPTLMKLIGESLGGISESTVQTKNKVVVGWDERPGNILLANYLTIGLNAANFEVIHIGLCATPTLHFATLANGAEFGCMITASHNPVDDSGLKIFNKYGYKTTPDFERLLSHTIISLAQEERELDLIDLEFLSKPSKIFEIEEWAIPNHRTWISSRVELLMEMLNFNSNHIPAQINTPFLIDSSKGFASHWFADWLTKWGINSIEVSKNAEALNFNCGAGDFSPTDEWTFDEAHNSHHHLLKQLPMCESGKIVAGAFDGDGDRCLLIETTEFGYRVIDGDRMADTIVNSMTNSGYDWTMAASIESNLSLTTNLDRFAKTVEVHETAVGDRWLSFKLSDQETQHTFIQSKNLPLRLGVEDSGHIVMAAPHPTIPNNWSLVGDGIMTLMSYLISLQNCTEISLMKRGWKKRQSVKNIDRSQWDGMNKLSNEVEHILKTTLKNHSTIEGWERGKVEGEQNLMMIACKYGGKQLSIGIRNSGTQEKISISARLEQGGNYNGIPETMNQVCEHLANNMINR